jgi:hypothetical protein
MVERSGRFLDTDKGGGIVTGYRDAVKDDPFNKKFLTRNYGQYDFLKKQGLNKKKGLNKLKKLSDTQLENVAAKAVLTQHKVKTRKLNTRYNRKQHNIAQAKKVLARKKAGLSVSKQAMRRTRAARAHVLRVHRNRQVMKSGSIYGPMPKGFRR